MLAIYVNQNTKRWTEAEVSLVKRVPKGWKRTGLTRLTVDKDKYKYVDCGFLLTTK